MGWPDVDAVVIGGSAGGVEALVAIVAALPADFPAAVLIVLHRGARDDDGATLAALLARHCALPVDDAWDHQPVQAGEVVMAPAGYHLLVDCGPVLALSVDEPVLWSRPAIDPLFESAADCWGPRLLAIVLTGASEDGSAGALAVRRAGGELWVQDPADAAVALMPQAAIDRAGADRVLSLAHICAALRDVKIPST
jgi:two-component system chemotaxis response regulator CheB